MINEELRSGGKTIVATMGSKLNLQISVGNEI